MNGEFMGAMNFITFIIGLILVVSFLVWKGSLFIIWFLIFLAVLGVSIGLLLFIACKIRDRRIK